MATTKLFQTIVKVMDESEQRYEADAEGGLIVAYMQGEQGT